MSSMDDLRTRLDVAVGSQVLVLLLSQNPSGVQEGASWVQKESLEGHPDPDLRVHVEWFSMLAGDSRSGWDECVISDPRVTHLRDERCLGSRAFAGEVEDAAAPVWDA
jgi:hypothetical protein